VDRHAVLSRLLQLDQFGHHVRIPIDRAALQLATADPQSVLEHPFGHGSLPKGMHKGPDRKRSVRGKQRRVRDDEGRPRRPRINPKGFRVQVRAKVRMARRLVDALEEVVPLHEREQEHAQHQGEEQSDQINNALRKDRDESPVVIVRVERRKVDCPLDVRNEANEEAR
jgi:hypothetical protein